MTQQTLRRAREIWHWALLSPLVYLLIAIGIDQAGWIDAEPLAPRPLDTPTIQGIILGLALAAIATLIFARVQQQRILRGAAGPAQPAVREHLERLLALWRRRYYLALAMADALAFLGLIYFLISARMWALMAAGAAAYLAYAACYPLSGKARKRNGTEGT